MLLLRWRQSNAGTGACVGGGSGGGSSRGPLDICSRPSSSAQLPERLPDALETLPEPRRLALQRRVARGELGWQEHARDFAPRKPPVDAQQEDELVLLGEPLP